MQDIFSNIFTMIQEDTYISILFWTGIILTILICIYYGLLIYNFSILKKEATKAIVSEDVIEKRISLIDQWFKTGKAKLIHPVIKRSWSKFFWEYSHSNSHAIPDIYESFKEDQIIQKTGWRKAVEAIPAIFVSLGILGTFYGITTGLSDINTGNGTEELQNSINVLLEGMRFAFQSSIAGIVISLIFQLFDKIVLYKQLTLQFDRLMITLDQTFPIKTESSILEEMLETQQEQMNDFKTFFADEFISKLTNGISESVQQSLDPHLQQSNDIMQSIVRSTTEEQSSKMNEMVAYFVDSLNKVTGSHMEDLGEVMTRAIEWQEKVYDEMNTFIEKLTVTADRQESMASQTLNLSGQLETYTTSLHDFEEHLTSSTQSLTETTKETSSVLEKLQALSDELNKNYESTNESFSSKLQLLNDTVDRMTSLGAAMNDLQEESVSAMQSFSDINSSINDTVNTNKELNTSLTDQYEKSVAWNSHTDEILSKVVQHTVLNEDLYTKISELFEAIKSERAQLDHVKDDQLMSFQRNTADLKHYWSENSKALKQNQEYVQELNSQLSEATNSFAEHMHRGVQHTFEQFDIQLKTAVQYLERGVNGIGEVVNSMEQDIDSISGQVSRFNELLEVITQSAESMDE